LPLDPRGAWSVAVGVVTVGKTSVDVA
jgi:hypothetical protein